MDEPKRLVGKQAKALAAKATGAQPGQKPPQPGGAA